jgi:fructosamine-3-kinase
MTPVGMTALWQAVARHVSLVTASPFRPEQIRSLGGGSINAAYCLSDPYRSFFVKCHRASAIDMFEAEAAGLQEIHQSQTVHVPLPVCWGVDQAFAYLVLDYLELGSNTSSTAVELGHQLALMHRHQAQQFGWHRHNTIGSTPQINTWTEEWVEFYREHRLGFQLRLARRQGHSGSWLQQVEAVMAHCDRFFESYHPLPSLLHGDLWGGNYGADQAGHPVIFDPAVYYGDRETDLAMTELFGGFPRQFYTAYDQSYPIDRSYQQRKPLYQLYHLLNHLNLFGSGYLSQVTSAVRQCLQVI